MEELKTVIRLCEEISKSNNRVFESCREEKISMDYEYGALYQAFWQAGLRTDDVIDLLKAIDYKLTNKQPALENVTQQKCDKSQGI